MRGKFVNLVPRIQWRTDCSALRNIRLRRMRTPILPRLRLQKEPVTHRSPQNEKSTSCEVLRSERFKVRRKRICYAWDQGSQPCFNLFSIVMHDAVRSLLILPQRFRCNLKVSSSIAPDAKISLSQDSVSAHSFLAISSFECISARLCGYCASVILANTLDDDFFI